MVNDWPMCRRSANVGGSSSVAVGAARTIGLLGYLLLSITRGSFMSIAHLLMASLIVS